MDNEKTTRTLWAVGFVFLLGFLLILPQFFTSGYMQQSCIMVLLFAYWATCWNILSGFAGAVSLGHAVYVGIGAYVTTVLYRTYGISPWAGMLASGLVAGLVSCAIGYPCFKLRGAYFTLATVALLHVLRLIVTSNDTLFGFEINGARGLDVPWKGEEPLMMHFMNKQWYMYIIIGLLALAFYITHRINESRMGYYLAAVNTNQDAAASLGVNVLSYKLQAMFISAFMTALGGAFYSQLIIYVDPQRVLGYELSAEILFLAIIGGQGTIFGPALGAILMVTLNEYTRVRFSSLSGLSLLIYGVIFMLVVFFMPKGIHGLIKNAADKIAGHWRGSTGSAAGEAH